MTHPTPKSPNTTTPTSPYPMRTATRTPPPPATTGPLDDLNLAALIGLGLATAFLVAALVVWMVNV